MKTKKYLKMLSLLLALTLIMSAFAGCGSSSDEAEEDDEEETEETAAEETTEETEEVEEEETEAEEESVVEEEETITIEYPISDGSAELSMFMVFSEQQLVYFDSNDDTIFWPELEERTGVHIEFQTATNSALSEQFNIMVVSGDYTDLVHSVHQFYTSGLDAAIEQEVIMPLNDYIETCMPDYLAVLESDEDMYKAALTDGGYFAIARGFYDTIFSSVYGPVIRQDWLDAVGMDVPVTYDDLYEVMTAFKVELGAEYGIAIPYTGVPFGDYLVAGYGVSGFALYSRNFAPFYQEDGVVKYGVIEDGFKEYLTMMNQWYEEGLIDQDFFSYTANFTYPEDSEISSEKVGIWYTQASLMGNYTTWFDDDTTFELTAMKDTVKTEGEVTHFYYAQDLGAGLSVGITTACEDVELACKWINYAYTEEGNILYNYGVEGVSFEYDDDGNPVLTDVVVADPDFPMAYAIGYYAQSNGAFIVDSQRLTVGYSGSQSEAMSIWASSTDGEYSYPYYATMTSDEGDEFATIYNDIDTYVTTTILEFIVGDEPLENFDAFVEQVKELGIDDCIAIKQAALDRYNAR